MPSPAQLAPSAVDIPAPELHEAEVLDTATALGQSVRCVVPSFDDSLTTDPLPWQPYVTAAGVFYPKKDDRAVLSRQIDGTPVIVWWEPSATEPDAAPSIPKSLIDAKGDLLAGTADNTVGRMGPVGANDTLLIADSSKTTGMKWAGLPSASVEEAQLGSALKKLAVTEPVRSTVETLKTIRGRIEVTETEAKVIVGAGFSAARNAKGISTVTFSAEFSAIPCVTATATGALVCEMNVAPSKSSFKLITAIPSTLVAENGSYDFIAIGPR